MFKTNKLSCLFVVSLLIIIFQPMCFALETANNLFLEEIDLPQGLNFTTSESCSGHAYFMQAAANDNGQFVIYSRHVNPNDPSAVDFEKVYIDVYNSDGSFFQEISFMTPLDLAVEYKTHVINIYFYSSALVYELTTQELHHYAIADGEATNGDIYKQLRNKNFSAGSWEYSYKKGFNGYVKLLRSNGEQEHLLVEMPGTSKYSLKVVVPGIIVGLIGATLVMTRSKRRQSHNHSNQGTVRNH